MSAKIFHWQCDFCGSIVNTDIFSVRKRCPGSIKGKKCRAFMRRINEEELAEHRTAVFKKMREFSKT